MKRREKIHLYGIAITAAAACFFALAAGTSRLRPAETLACSEVSSRINPNTAGSTELQILPGIGPSRAGAIVRYRSVYSGKKVFKCCRDLEAVKGIGPRTAEKICKWLIFD